MLSPRKVTGSEPQMFEEWKEKMKQEQLKRNTPIVSITFVPINEDGEIDEEFLTEDGKIILDEETLNAQEELKKEFMKEHKLETLDNLTLGSFEDVTNLKAAKLIPEDNQKFVIKNKELDDNMDESDDMNEGDDD